MAALNIPDLGPSLRFLNECDHPSIRLQLAEMHGATQTSLCREVADLGMVHNAFALQNSDGSWGEHERAGNRLLPTLWMVKTLGELGLDERHQGWLRALEFLGECGHTSAGVFTIRGDEQGVLSCYVGTVASIYLRTGRTDLAAPQVEWILNHQEVQEGGKPLRSAPVAPFSPHLKEQYGGCMAETTCLVGLLRTGAALVQWSRHSEDRRVDSLVSEIRSVFLDRRVFYRSNGSIIPLAVSPKKAEDWLAPTYPLDWRIDLIEAIDFLAQAGSPDERMQEAIDHIVGLRLPDGSWPLRRTFKPDHLDRLESRSTRVGSPFITMRVVRALHRLAPAA